MHCSYLRGKEVQEGDDVCLCMANSVFCMAETNATSQSKYTLIKTDLKSQHLWNNYSLIITLIYDGIQFAGVLFSISELVFIRKSCP